MFLRTQEGHLDGVHRHSFLTVGVQENAGSTLAVLSVSSSLLLLVIWKQLIITASQAVFILAVLLTYSVDINLCFLELQ